MYVGIPAAISAIETPESKPNTSAQIVRRLLVREGVPADGEQRVVGEALQRTCARVHSNLRESMGDDGCTALLARALARTEAKHPALTSIRRISRGNIALDGVASGVETHGAAAVTAAVEALLAALMDVLGNLIGDDMAIRLIELGAPRARRGDAASSS